MKQLILSVSIIILFELLVSECANPRTPTGGPKDTIPPSLVEAFPPSESINTNEQEITLVFTEFINVEKLKTNLIITPSIEIKYKSIPKKNELTLKFEKPFPDSTTITFNFFDGITDVNERTPAVNLTYVFSTGDFIDSLKVSGQVNHLMTGTPSENTIVGLFSYTDTLDIFITKPTYFTSSDEEGQFEIRNIESGSYRILAFVDTNRNLLFDANQEAYGFLSNLIVLDTNVNNLIIPLVKQDASKLRLITTRTLGSHFDVQYSKSLEQISLSTNIQYGLSDDFKTVRIYQPDNFNIEDSLQSHIKAIDSLGNEQLDTLFINFNKNNRAQDKFKLELTPSGRKITPIQDYLLTFNKPVTTFNPEFIRYEKDSTFHYPLDSLINFNWNDIQNQLSFTSTFDTTNYFKDQKQLIAAADTIVLDTTIFPIKPDTLIGKVNLENKKIQSRDKQPSNVRKPPQLSNSIDLIFGKGTFISVENDTLKKVTAKASFIKQPETGIIILNIITEKPSYLVQLLDPSYNVLKEFTEEPEIIIANLIPDKYGIRILIDNNQDGEWSIGNILQFVEPESVYILDSFTTLRENFEVTLDITF